MSGSMTRGIFQIEIAPKTRNETKIMEMVTG